MTLPTLTLAMVTDVFPGRADDDRLVARLTEAKKLGAEVAVLPELPLDRWIPAGPTPAGDDAEDPGGARQQRLVSAARASGIAVLGGAIVRDPTSGERRNRALLVAADGRVLGHYDKNHLPSEEGFWETAHYQPGKQPPQVLHGLPMALGVQLCSDTYRPDGTLLLAASGAELVVVPRATPPETWWRWQLMLRANAIMSACWVVSVNRPAGEAGSLVGGPSTVIAPDGTVVLETSEPVAVVELDRAAVTAARRGYPGYLAIRAELYAAGWTRLTSSS